MIRFNSSCLRPQDQVALLKRALAAKSEDALQLLSRAESAEARLAQAEGDGDEALQLTAQNAREMGAALREETRRREQLEAEVSAAEEEVRSLRAAQGSAAEATHEIDALRRRLQHAEDDHRMALEAAQRLHNDAAAELRMEVTIAIQV